MPSCSLFRARHPFAQISNIALSFERTAQGRIFDGSQTVARLISNYSASVEGSDTNSSDTAVNQQRNAAQQSQTNNVDNQSVGNTTVGSLEKTTMSNEDKSLSTPKNGDPAELEKGKEALANAIINNAELDYPAKVAPATGTATSQDA